MIVLPALREPATIFTRYTFDPMSLNPTNDWQQWDTHVRMMDAYFTNTAYTDLVAWARYRYDYRLYRHTKPIYNPTNRLVNFYAGVVYPGRLTTDPDRLPDGNRNAMPLDKQTTSQDLQDAFVQLWQWSNWQAKKSVMVRYGAMAGSVLVEVVDDVERGKVYFEVINPRKVSGLVLDAAGNVKAYSLEYDVWDPDEKKAFRYRKEVTSRTIAYFRDGEPWNRPGVPSVLYHPYGFAPAVWAKHNDIGSAFGTPCIFGSIPKIDEINSLLSHVNDHVHKIVEAPKVLWGGDTVQDVLLGNEDSYTNGLLEKIKILIGDPGGSATDLVGDLGLDKAMLVGQEMIAEVEKDHPELQMWGKVREMQAVSGVAIMRMMGDVVALVDEAAANYDQQVIKLHQMAVAIAGFRLRDGYWPNPNRQQQRFKNFTLDSYFRGDLDFDIMPRPLIVPTALEVIETERARTALRIEQAEASAPADLEQRLLNTPPAEQDDNTPE